MNEIILGIVIVLLCGGALLGLLHWLANVDRYREEMTEEEYEERLEEGGPNLLGAGMSAFDQMMRPDVKKAIEYRQDQQRGQTGDEDLQGEALEDDEH